MPDDRRQEATLEKLELEIEALKRDKSFETETEPERKRKLYYDTQSVRWQTSLIYRLSQFATIVTIFATAFGIYSAYTKIVSDRLNEFEQKQKDRTERTLNQYRLDVERLLEYPNNDKQTISQVVFLFSDLQNVVETGFDANRNDKREQAGSLVSELIRSPEFDLDKIRNINFDRKAMADFPFYSDYLIHHPLENRDVLSKYKTALLDLHDRDPKYYETFEVEPQDETSFIENKVSKDQTRFFQYAYLFQAYKKHVALLAANSGVDKPDPHLTGHLDLAFCWFWDATRNRSLITSIFGGTVEQVEKKTSACYSRNY